MSCVIFSLQLFVSLFALTVVLVCHQVCAAVLLDGLDLAAVIVSEGVRPTAWALFSFIVLFSSHYIAVCSPACQGGGTCVAPNTCMCPDGLQGSSCGEGT